MSEAFIAGKKAYQDQQAYTANPYSVYITTEFLNALEWSKGWRQACNERIEESCRNFNRTYEQSAARRGQYT